MTRSIYVRTREKGRRQDGMAFLAVIFAISAFSALAVTVLTDKALEATLASGGELALSLPGRNAPSPKAPWAAKITRAELGESEFQIRIPVSADFQPELLVGTDSNPGGWTSVVQVAPGVRVCCDGGDGQCRNRPFEETTWGTPDPTWSQPLSQGSPTQSLVFSLLTGSEPQSSASANSSLFYTVNAKPQPADPAGQPPQEAVAISPPAAGGGVVACQLERADAVLAQGVFRLQQAPPPVGDGSDRVLEGTLSLDYFRPSGGL